jgi:hypothetical protein
LGKVFAPTQASLQISVDPDVNNANAMSLGSVFAAALIVIALLLFFVNVSFLFLFDPLSAQHTSKVALFLDNKKAKKSTSESIVLHDNLEPFPRPRLSSLVQGWNITGDVSWLLQFSIVGFPKSGTSTLMFHLQTHPEIHIFPHERCEMAYNQHVHLIEDMYRQFPSASNESHRFVRGIKCPIELESTKTALRNYLKYFPTTDFIVGIRHPILWYVQSLLFQ